MQIEDVPGIGLPSGWTPQQQTQLTIGIGVFAQVVVNAECIFVLFNHEVFGHGTARIRRDVLQRGAVRGRSRDHHGVVHRSVTLEGVDNFGDGTGPLTDGHIDTDNALAFLVDDRIQGDGGFAGLTVADNQLALASTDGDHGIHTLETGLQRLLDGLSLGDAGSIGLDQTLGRSLETGTAVNRFTKRIDHASQDIISYGHGH